MSSAEERLRGRIRRAFLPPECEWNENQVHEIEDRVLNLIRLYSDPRSTGGSILRAEEQLRRSLGTNDIRGAASRISKGRKA